MFVATSGEGFRASMWSYLAIQHLYKKTNGILMRQMNLSAGSSGGIIGLAYFRELRMQNLITEDNDLLIRSHKFEQNGE